MSKECDLHCWHVTVVSIYRNAVLRQMRCCHCGVECSKVNGDESIHGPWIVSEPRTERLNRDYE